MSPLKDHFGFDSIQLNDFFERMMARAKANRERANSESVPSVDASLAAVFPRPKSERGSE
jgi:hypothetical protein